MTSTASKTAHLYARISSDRTGAGLGVERQLADCRTLAEERGYAIVETFADNDISAFSGKPRPAYEAMLKRLSEVDAVIIWHADRLHRNLAELERYIDACTPHSVDTLAVKSGTLDLSTASGRTIARILGAVAAGESEQKAERLRAQKKQAKAAGRFLGGAVPFGYTKAGDALTPDPTSAALILSACEMILDGGSLASVLRHWDASEVRPRRAAKWDRSTVLGILKHPRNAGLIASSHGGLIAGGPYPAILPEDTWRATVAALNDGSRRTSFTVANRWLLSGIGVCWCGAPVQVGHKGNANGSTVAAYRCSLPASQREPGSKHANKAAIPVDAYVETIVLGVLADPDFRAAVAERASAQPVDKEASTKAAAIRQRLSEATVSYTAGKLSLSTLEAVSGPLEAELSALEAAMDQAPVQTVLPDGITYGDVREFWASASLEVKRSILRSVFRVRLLPTAPGAPRRFNPDTVAIGTRTWWSAGSFDAEADVLSRAMN